MNAPLGKIHVKDYYKKANSEAYKPPRWETYDDLERKYWKRYVQYYLMGPSWQGKLFF